MNCLHTSFVPSDMGEFLLLPPKYISSPLGEFMLDADDLFSGVFGSRCRVKILAALSDRPMSVMEISSLTGLEQTSVSHNLRFLKDCNILSKAVVGKYHIYKIRDEYGVLVSDMVKNVRRHRKMIERLSITAFLLIYLLRPVITTDPQLFLSFGQYTSMFNMLGTVF